ncbi:MAG: aminoglycoside phosphotransferase family protein [Acidimicrobiales bacterium]
MTPPPSIVWAEQVLGPIDAWTDLPGGMSSEIRRCRSGRRSFVVRHITDLEWRQREPGLIDAEATALTLLQPSSVRAPRLLASSPADGMLAMSWVPGELATTPSSVAERAGDLGRLAASIAAVPLPSEHALPEWRSWAPERPTVPDGGDEALWRRAIAAGRTDAPSQSSAVLLHRDLHPLNVLWDASGPVVVDWVNACVGHPHAELGHARWNLAVLGDEDAADAMLAAYNERSSFGPYSPWWDIMAVLGLLPLPVGLGGWHAVGRTDLTAARVLDATERFLERSLAAFEH